MVPYPIYDAPVRPCSDFDIYITDEKARTQDLGSFVAMEVMGDDPSGSFSIRDEKVEPVDLLEEFWFFENLFERRKMMSRCYSDPCASSNFCQEMMVRNSFANDHSPPPTEKLPEGDDSVGHNSPSLPCVGRRGATQEEGTGPGQSKSTQKPPQNHLLRTPSLLPSPGRREGEIQFKDIDLVQPNLLRAPSLPPCVGRNEGEVQEREINLGSSKLAQKSSRRSLIRTPSMPPCVGREELIPRGSKLTRTTSLTPPDILPPQHTSKGLAQSYSIPRHRPPRKQEEGSMSMDVAKEMRRRYLNQTQMMRKSLSDLEYEEVQGFKDLGFTFEKEELSPSVVNILPGLQNKDRGGQMEEDSVRRPYLSEAWLEQCSAPPIPNWVGKSSAQDMKAQIKFWARAVASNVRQEC